MNIDVSKPPSRSVSDATGNSSPDPVHSGNRRQQQPSSRTTKQQFLQRIKQEYFLDILRARAHSKHFRHTRAQYISSRVRSIAFILAVVIPAWIAVDALYLPREQLQTIAILRLLTGAACLGLSFWAASSHHLHLSRVKLALLVLIPSLFQTAANLYLINADLSSIPAGYHFFPFLIISLGAIFPLTILEGGHLATFIVGLYVGTAHHLGQLQTLQTLNDIWLLVLLALIAGWAALTQLTMLMRLYRQAHRDPLTGLANRRSLMNFLGREVAHCAQQGVPLTIMLFDLDKFKRINDRYGHATGDEVLKVFARLAVAQSRQEDLVGRFGGEEFLMILHGTRLPGAERIGERLRRVCEQEPIEAPGEESFAFTTSIGIAQLRPGESLEQLLKRADEALYRAKGEGRNRIVSAE